MIIIIINVTLGLDLSLSLSTILPRLREDATGGIIASNKIPLETLDRYRVDLDYDAKCDS
jgi:hypothetical protein